MNQPWKTDDWFVSLWNYDVEVVSDFSFAPQVKIHDVTLRDGEQQAGIVYRRDDKVRIAAKLAEAGVHRIEAGVPAVSKDDADAIKEIVKLNLGPEIFAFSRCMVDDVKRAVDCGVTGVIIEIPCSEHMIELGYNWPLQKAIELSIEATRFAKEQGLYVVYFPVDASRADLPWYLNQIETVASQGHMDALAVVDTMGACSPHAIPYFIRKTRERIKKPLETHFHNDFGMAAANTLLALAAGADVAHVTVTGIGERAGNAALEQVVVALRAMYDRDLGININKLCELAHLVAECSRMPIPPNQPMIGGTLFSVEAGIPAAMVRRTMLDHPTELYPYASRLLGQHSPEIVLGKKSGRDSVEYWLDRLGLKADEEAVKEILSRIKTRSLEKKGSLTIEEFKEEAANVISIP